MVEQDAAATLDRVPPGDLGIQTPLLHLRSGGVSLLLQLSPTALPVVRHWGADLGELAGRTDPWTALDAVEPLFCLIPEPGDVWRADPALSGARDGGPTAWAVASCQARLFSETELSGGVVEIGADTVIIEAEDPVAQLSLDLAIQLTDAGVVCCRAGITNHADRPYWLDGLSLYLPAGDSATHRIELDGSPIATVPLRPGGLTNDSDGGELAQLLVGEAWAGFQRGQVWQAHVAFTGATSHRCVTAGTRSYLGGGERLAAGEVVLGQEESYHSPWVLWSWGLGLDAAAARLHRNARRAGGHPAPLIFDATAPAFASHDPQAMLLLAEYAAAVGAEAILLDLGWCVRAGLDPYSDHDGAADTETPDHLAGLLSRIGEFDLEVGLAIEPDRLDPSSTIVTDHPDWLLTSTRDGVAEPVLDLSVRPAMVHAWERLTKLLNQHPVSLLQWSAVVDRRPGTARARHASTLAGYRLLDALRERYPAMTVVSPAMDLAMAKRSSGTDRAPDAMARHRGFAAMVQLRPPGLIWQPAYDEPEDGASPGFRAISAFFGQLGLGLDLRKQAPQSLRSIHRWLAIHKQHRTLLHTGHTVRSDQSDRGFSAHGVVADDKAAALFAFTWLEKSGVRRVRLDGLDSTATYRLEVVGTRSAEAQAVTPPWSANGESLLMSGRVLETAGIVLPAARRGSALLLHLVAEISPDDDMSPELVEGRSG